MEYTNIKLEREKAVATIRLNRPAALNALSPELLQEFFCRRGRGERRPSPSRCWWCEGRGGLSVRGPT